jgi:tetratricopeptide (TPR) repeat protein
MLGKIRLGLCSVVCGLVHATGLAQPAGSPGWAVDTAPSSQADRSSASGDAQGGAGRPRLNSPSVRVRTITPAVRTALAAAQEALGQGDADKSLALFDSVLVQEPGNHYALIGKAAALQKLGRPAQAQQQLQAAVAAGGDSFVLQANMALLMAERDPRAAAMALARPNPAEQNAAYHAVMGQIWAMAGDHAQAVEHWQRALRQNPSNATLLWNHAVSLDHLERRPQAIEQYRSALLVMAGYPGDEDTAQLQRNALARLQYLEASMSPRDAVPAVPSASR